MIGANRPPLTLSSRTYVKLPAPRSRNTLGVGESVALTASLSDGQWTTTAGELSATTGNKVTLRAPRTAGTATVTVTAGNQAASISFNVIAPSSLRMRFDRGWHKVLNPPWPHAGMRCQPFIGPDTANFRNVEVVEEDVEAVASGCWAVWHGRGHGPETEYIPASSTVKSGWGTALPIFDRVDSGGLATNPRPTDWTGQLTFDIPIRWRCGSATGLIAVVRHLTQTDAAGTTTISKGGASYTAPMT
jgi:hypothetical protein